MLKTINEEVKEMYGVDVKGDSYLNYDRSHGSPWDRGSADSYYHRAAHPHFFKGATYQSEKVEEKDMDPEQIQDYYMGYAWNEVYGDKKRWD